jgi:hypothetical protein
MLFLIDRFLSLAFTAPAAPAAPNHRDAANRVPVDDWRVITRRSVAREFANLGARPRDS